MSSVMVVPSCGKCGSRRDPAGWCPLAARHLCAPCLVAWTDVELRATYAGRDDGEWALLKAAGVLS